MVKKITVNVCLNLIRSKKIQFVHEAEVVNLYHQQSEDNSNVSNANVVALTKAIQSLPEGYRTVFNMYAVDGFTHHEIAEHLDISVSTSKTQYYKARKKLYNLLTQNQNNNRV